MSPSNKKKKGKQRPPFRYRKKARNETPRATSQPQSVSAPRGGSAPAPPAPREPASPRTGRIVSLHPLAPIIVRSARPMNAHTDADPAQFPPPSTVAGCLRTAWARATDRPFGPELAQLAVAGPLLVRDDDRVLAPKPADALYFGRGEGKDESPRCVRARPHAFGSGCGADLPAGLLPVQLTEQLAGKPGDGPAWWTWEDLLAFREGTDVPIDQLRRNGWSPPKGDRRTHVSIDPSTGTTAAGALYETEGLDLDVAPAAFRTRAVGRTEADWVFRTNWNADFGGSGTRISEEVEPRFREVEHGFRKWNIDSGGSGTSVPGVVNARR